MTQLCSILCWAIFHFKYIYIHTHTYVCVCVCVCVSVCVYVSVLVIQLSDYDPVDCSPPGSSVHGIFQGRILDWIAISFSRDVCIYVYMASFYPFLCWWTFGLLPSTGYCEQCCNEPWGTCVFWIMVFFVYFFLCLMLSQRSLKLSSTLFILFFLCSAGVISIILGALLFCHLTPIVQY